VLAPAEVNDAVQNSWETGPGAVAGAVLAPFRGAGSGHDGARHDGHGDTGPESPASPLGGLGG
jgi:hypothetical protein